MAASRFFGFAFLIPSARESAYQQFCYCLRLFFCDLVRRGIPATGISIALALSVARARDVAVHCTVCGRPGYTLAEGLQDPASAASQTVGSRSVSCSQSSRNTMLKEGSHAGAPHDGAGGGRRARPGRPPGRRMETDSGVEQKGESQVYRSPITLFARDGYRY